MRRKATRLNSVAGAKGDGSGNDARVGWISNLVGAKMEVEDHCGTSHCEVTGQFSRMTEGPRHGNHDKY